MYLAYSISTFRFLAIALATVFFGACATPPQVGTASQKSVSNFAIDNANLFNSEQIGELEALLSAHNQNGFGQISLLVISQLPQNASIESYALAALQAKLATDNARSDQVLVIIAMQNKLMRIQTSEAVWKALPDEVCQQIIDKIMIPIFKQERYFYGVRGGLDAIIERLKTSAYEHTA